MVSLTEYWPQGVKYGDSRYIIVDYPETNPNKPPNDHLQHVVESWKYTASIHRLDSAVAKALVCAPCVEHEGFYDISYLESEISSKKTTIHGKIIDVEAEFIVDKKTPTKKVYITIRIKGICINADDKFQFNLYIAVHRSPKEESNVSLNFRKLSGFIL